MAQRKGRKRKSGERGSTGRLRPATGESPVVVALRMPHRKSLKDKAHDQKAENPLGRLNLSGVITDAEYEAGRMFARAVTRMLRVMSAPAASPPSIAGFGEPSGGDGHLPDDIAQRWQDAYNDAFEALTEHAGHRAMVALRFVCVQEAECQDDQLHPLRCGLRVLVNHYGLTSGANHIQRAK